jgi:dipeptidyl aminopeptidase/acylaminoacyl peptidase
MQALSDFKDPAPQLTGIKKELIKYKREDGVDLSGTLYLPPGYKEGQRLPVVVWAYPLECSGAYNRTLTPFGFQSERRTLWEARDTYINMSPFMHADKINEPILLRRGR